MASSIVLMQENPIRYQPRVDGLLGLSLVDDANEAAYFVQLLHRMTGKPPADFSDGLTPERKKAIEDLARNTLTKRGLI